MIKTRTTRIGNKLYKLIVRIKTKGEAKNFLEASDIIAEKYRRYLNRCYKK